MIKVIFLTFLFSNTSFAGKWLDLEWGSVEGATGYELEVIRVQGAEEFPLGIFQSKKSKYKKNVIPGQYKIKIRTIDGRGVPGDWSEPIEVAVDITGIERYRPLKNEEIPNTKGTKDVDVSFVWEKIEGIKDYHLTVTENEGGTIFSDKVKGISQLLKLEPAKTYRWSIAAVIEGKIGESSESWDFTVLGKSLSAPTARITKSENTLDLNFAHESDKVQYDFQLFRNNQGTLKKLLDKKKYSKNIFRIKSNKFKKGEYKLEVKAKNPSFLDSYPTIVEFYFDGYTISYLGSDRMKSRSFRNWHLFLAAGYGSAPYHTETDLFNTGSELDIDMPNIKMESSLSYKLGGGELGFHLVNENFTSSEDSFFSRKLRLYYLSKDWRFGSFGIQGGLGYYRIRSFILLSDSALESRVMMPFKASGLDWQLNFKYYWSDTWTFWIEFLSSLGIQAEDSFIYPMSFDEGNKDNTINTLMLNATYKFNEKLDITLGFYFHTEELYFRVFPQPGGSENTFTRLDTLGGQINFDFFF